jgi:hypothetical protein
MLTGFSCSSQLLFLTVRTAPRLRAPIGQQAGHGPLLVLKEWAYSVLEHIGCPQRRFPSVALATGPFPRGIPNGLLVNPPPAFARAHVARRLCASLARTCTRTHALGFVGAVRFLSRRPVRFGQPMPRLRPLWLRVRADGWGGFPAAGVPLRRGPQPPQSASPRWLTLWPRVTGPTLLAPGQSPGWPLRFPELRASCGRGGAPSTPAAPLPPFGLQLLEPLATLPALAPPLAHLPPLTHLLGPLQ